MLKLHPRDLWYYHGHDCDVHFVVRAWYILGRWGKYLRELQLRLLSSIRGSDCMLKLRRWYLRNRTGCFCNMHYFVRGGQILRCWGKRLF